ncbi:MAG: 3-dehydroquinate synthase [Bacteroidota bacterium]|nr:3-dehydroquinate synthase [Christiangramia flava]MAM18733.1 3-dehydroquinate synthase [Christiangramia sp.]MEE2771689.1 3-dehydroquinate synthase [Bacteroidota bacterium]
MNDLQDSLDTIFYSEKAYGRLNKYLSKNPPSRIFILVDTNTNEHCLTYFLSRLEDPSDIEVIEIDAGEEYKTLETCDGVWNAMSELDGDRKSLMINLGGGVVTDLGGFVASTFKRGIPFINIPTTLLAMVDASVGGKTGVDLGNLKNQVGVIVQPEMVLIDTNYLSTLPQPQMRSGLAEILKHGLIADEKYWKKLRAMNELKYSDLDDIIEKSVKIKANIVDRDPYERDERKTLNFGHTLGHAIESFCLSNPDRKILLHGEAIAIGMILEAYISAEEKDFPKEKLEDLNNFIKDIYGVDSFSSKEIKQIQKLLKYDKKNEYGRINFVLLEDIGLPVIDCEVDPDLIEKSFDYYLNS